MVGPLVGGKPVKLSPKLVEKHGKRLLKSSNIQVFCSSSCSLNGTAVFLDYFDISTSKDILKISSRLQLEVHMGVS